MSDAFNISELLNKLNDNENLINILIQFESFLDNLDIYAYKNWFDGEIVDGPNVERYWVSVMLKYPYDKIPDPKGAKRLVEHGCKVLFKKSYEMVSVFPDTVKKGDLLGGQNKPELKKEKICLLTITIPRKFISELDDADLELYANEINVDDISDARKDNIDSNSDIKDEEDNYAI